MLRRRVANPYTQPVTIDLVTVIDRFTNQDPKEIFPIIHQISVQQHLFWAQWAQTMWKINVINAVIDIMRRYELNELQFHGKTIYIVTMMLNYGIDSQNFAEDRQGMRHLIEATLRIFLQYHVYHSCILLLELLIDKFRVTPQLVFELGCSLLDQLPVIINDDNFIALLHFAAKHCVIDDPKTLLCTVKCLATCSGHILGEFKSNFFLNKCTPLFKLGLSEDYCRLGGDRYDQDITWYTLRMLRLIASAHPESNKKLGKSDVLPEILKFLPLFDTFSEKLLRELLALLNTIAGGQIDTCLIIKQHTSLSLLKSLADKKFISLYDLIVELFINLYESGLIYDDQKMVYKVKENTEEGQFISHCLSTIMDKVEELYQIDCNISIPATFESESLPYMEFLSRTMNKLERSLKVISNPSLFIIPKLRIIQILTKILKDPKQGFSRYLSSIDVFVLLYSGSAQCWQSIVQDIMDSEFLHLSHKLVEDFLQLANDRIFDNRDRNSLHYLAGSDKMNTIQQMISQSSTSTAELTNSPLVKSPSFCSRNNSNIQSAVYSPSEDMAEKYLHAMVGLCNQLLKDSHRVSDVAKNWEKHSNESNLHKLVHVHLLSSIIGWERLQHFIPCASDLPNSIISLLAEERFRMKNTTGLEKKMVEMIGNLVETMGSFELSADCSVYLTKIITSRPDGLSSNADITKSEYIRQAINTDTNDLSLLLRSSSISSPRSSITSDLLENFDLHYAAVTTLISLCNHDRNVRRKLVATCTEIIQSLYYFAPVDPVNFRPVMHLIKSMLEFMPKVEMNAEEAIVSVIIRSLHSPLHYNQAQACDLIYQIGIESPGFVYRALSRLEVEEALVDILNLSSDCNYSQLLLSALKAVTAIVHNPNLKPAWFPLPWLYHWSQYRPGLQSRVLLSVQGLSLIITVLKNVEVAYRLPIFTFTLSAAASLMYACVDDLLRPIVKEDEHHIKALKAMLISNILPWLPIAMDFITLGKKKKKARDHSDSIVSLSTPFAEKEEGIRMQQSKDLLTIEAGQSEAFVIKRADKQIAERSVHNSVLSHSTVNATVYTSQAVEALTEKTLEALYAFLCTDEIIPLSTYITYIKLFEQSPLIASVSYFMTENKTNVKILRRGIDFIRYFAENEMNLSIIAMHTPAALMTAIYALKHNLEVQISFCKVILKIAKMNDDFARENLIRFKVHMAVVDMINSHQHALTLLAIQATTALAASENNVLDITDGIDLVDCLIKVLDVMVKNIPEQVEALQSLIWLDSLVPDLVSTSSKKGAIFAAMKRSRKLVAAYLQTKKTQANTKITNNNSSASSNSNNEVEIEKVHQVLEDPIWRVAGCTIS